MDTCGWIEPGLDGTYTLEQGYAIACGSPATEIRVYDIEYHFCSKHAEKFDSIVAEECA